MEAKLLDVLDQSLLASEGEWVVEERDGWIWRLLWGVEGLSWLTEDAKCGEAITHGAERVAQIRVMCEVSERAWNLETGQWAAVEAISPARKDVNAVANLARKKIEEW